MYGGQQTLRAGGMGMLTWRWGLCALGVCGMVPLSLACTCTIASPEQKR
jgi:hypothetical protein